MDARSVTVNRNDAKKPVTKTSDKQIFETLFLEYTHSYAPERYELICYNSKYIPRVSILRIEKIWWEIANEPNWLNPFGTLYWIHPSPRKQPYVPSYDWLQGPTVCLEHLDNKRSTRHHKTLWLGLSQVMYYFSQIEYKSL